MITQNEVREIFNYDENTGAFTWKIRRANCIKVGTQAGSYHQGYRRVELNNKGYLVHRLIWLYVYGYFPENEIDHINHIRDDNRLCNLREVTKSENAKNQSKHSTNKSGHLGVHWHKHQAKWCANITYNGKVISLGYYHNKEDAINARVKAEILYGFHQNHGV